MDAIIKKADVLIEALPYIRAFRKKTIVIKYGGSILGEDSIRKGVLEDIVFLHFIGLRPVLVHGGGPNISERMKTVGKKSEFHEGMRVTDADTLAIVDEELKKLNSLLVSEIKGLHAHASGLSGEKRNLITVKRKKGKRDLGFVGDIQEIKFSSIKRVTARDCIPVICPMGIGDDGLMYNINADDVASAIAVGLKAEKFVLLTNVKGIMRNPHDPESLLSTLKVDDAKALIKEGVIQEGMIPKVQACIKTEDGGVNKTHIIDARIPHALLLEIFTDKGIGTEILT
ncbi:acetylglutamate kinase [Candidatus Omnitrophota bacterium]